MLVLRGVPPCFTSLFLLIYLVNPSSFWRLLLLANIAAAAAAAAAVAFQEQEENVYIYVYIVTDRKE